MMNFSIFFFWGGGGGGGGAMGGETKYFPNKPFSRTWLKCEFSLFDTTGYKMFLVFKDLN